MKRHSMWLARVFTVEGYRLVYKHQAEEYRIWLEQRVDDHGSGWLPIGVVARDVAFDRIEPVWVFLCKQDTDAWLKLYVI